MSTIKLLLVEDDPNFSYMVKGGLEDLIGGYEIWTASNGQEGLELWRAEQPDVILVDIEMPVMDGYEMVKRIRETDINTLIIYTSARISPKDVVQSYQLGGNEYIKKPCVPEELDVRIKGLLNLKNNIVVQDESKLFQIGKFMLDVEHAILRYDSENIIRLTALENSVLQTLCENRGQTVKRELLLEKHWNKKERDFYTSRCLDTLLLKLRRKLVEDPTVEIKVFKGVGVMLAD